MARGSAVEEGWVGVVHHLSEGKRHVLFPGSERSVGRLVARSQFRALGDSVVVGTPLE